MRRCPFCAEEIQQDAIKCKHCGEWLDGRRPGAAPPESGGKPLQPAIDLAAGVETARQVASNNADAIKSWLTVLGFGLLVVGVASLVLLVVMPPLGVLAAFLGVPTVVIVIVLKMLAYGPDTSRWKTSNDRGGDHSSTVPKRPDPSDNKWDPGI